MREWCTDLCADIESFAGSRAVAGPSRFKGSGPGEGDEEVRAAGDYRDVLPFAERRFTHNGSRGNEWRHLGRAEAGCREIVGGPVRGPVAFFGENGNRVPCQREHEILGSRQKMVRFAVLAGEPAGKFQDAGNKQ